jgi:YbbR domain-containing protein
MSAPVIPPFIRVDFARKLLALLLATVIWYTVRFEILRIDSFHQVPVRLVYDSSKMYVEDPTQPVTLTFRGSKAKLEAIDPSELAVRIRIPEIEAGVFEYEVPLRSRRTVKTPRGTKLVSTTPDRLVLKVDRIIRRSLPIQIREQGKLAANYQVLKRETIPGQAQVRGPSRFVNALSTISTTPVRLDSGVTDSFQMKEVSLVSIPQVSVSPRNVSVSYEIARDDDNRKFEDVPVRVLNSVPPRFRVTKPVRPVTVILRGPKEPLAQLGEANIHPFVDISTAEQAGVVSYKVAVRVESGVQFTTEALMPSKVSVELVPFAEPSGGDGADGGSGDAPETGDEPSGTVPEGEVRDEGDGEATAPDGGTEAPTDGE